ncbi:hypothetical protein Q7P37_001687 [Cladosporium fusiforme]
MIIPVDDPRAKIASDAIRAGNVAALEQALKSHPELATAHIGSDDEARTLLHILADFPGKLPNASESAKALISAGSDVNAAFKGAHSETALHWAASNNDIALLDTLLDCGADIDAPGGVIAETPLADARAFLQLEAAQRLIARGAKATLQDVATLGLMDRVRSYYAGSKPSKTDTSNALWNACHGSQLETAQFLFSMGGDVNAVPAWEPLTPLDAAVRSAAWDVVDWLKNIGARSNNE